MANVKSARNNIGTPRDKLHQPVVRVKGMNKKGFAVNVIIQHFFTT